MKLLATTAAVGFSVLYQVHAKGNVTRCFFKKHTVTPSFSYDFGDGIIHDITCPDSYCSCDGSRTGYTGCQKCCCSKARKETSVEGKEAIIRLLHILALISHYFTRLLLLFLVSKELDSMFLHAILQCQKVLKKMGTKICVTNVNNV